MIQLSAPCQFEFSSRNEWRGCDEMTNGIEAILKKHKLCQQKKFSQIAQGIVLLSIWYRNLT